MQHLRCVNRLIFLLDNKHKEEGWLNNRQDSSGEKDTVVSVVSFTHSNFDSGLSELSGPQSHLSNKEVQSSKGQGKQKNDNEPVKFHEDGQTVKQDCISEQNQRNIPCVMFYILKIMYVKYVSI